MLLAACTQNDMNVDTAQNEKATARSTQAECDLIEYNLRQQLGSQITLQDCPDFEELLECRLNQGIDEDEVMSHCTQVDTYSGTACVDATTLLNDYTSVTDPIKVDVASATADCGGNCPNPIPGIGCRIIIFSNVSCENITCGGQTFFMYSYDATVYCC